MNNTFGKQILVELESEATATRKCLERIPVSKFDWKPHEKSMPLGYLALLVAEIPRWIQTMIDQSEIDFATFDHFQAKTTEELVNHFDENMEKARKALETVPDEALTMPFHLKRQGQILFTASKKDTLAPLINHQVHHRGQLTVYMRLNEIPVPSIYGPSADDRPW
ncbi:MAG TPA: DinB family protein [Acidobacteriota bacterium]